MSSLLVITVFSNTAVSRCLYRSNSSYKAMILQMKGIKSYCNLASMKIEDTNLFMWICESRLLLTVVGLAIACLPGNVRIVWKRLKFLKILKFWLCFITEFLTKTKSLNSYLGVNRLTIAADQSEFVLRQWWVLLVYGILDVLNDDLELKLRLLQQLLHLWHSLGSHKYVELLTVVMPPLQCCQTNDFSYYIYTLHFCSTQPYRMRSHMIQANLHSKIWRNYWVCKNSDQM